MLVLVVVVEPAVGGGGGGRVEGVEGIGVVVVQLVKRTSRAASKWLRFSVRSLVIAAAVIFLGEEEVVAASEVEDEVKDLRR